jgi:DnaJ-domain-containing protein 1
LNLQAAQSYRQLYLAKRTGVLMSEAGEDRRGVFFRSGFIVAARSSRPEDRFGELLMRKGRISKQQFEDASHFIKSGWKLGEILAELKLLEKEEVEDFLRLQLLEISCAVLIESITKLTFSNLSEVDNVVVTPLSVANVLMEAARRTPEIHETRNKLKGDSRYLGFSTEPLLKFQDIDLAPEEAYILSRIDGTQSAQDIFTLSPLGEEQTARTLLGLLESGIIEPEGEVGRREVESTEAGAAEISESKPVSDDQERREINHLFGAFQQRDHWEVLGIARGADAKVIKRAFHEMVRKHHPDHFSKVTDPELQEKISYIFTRIGEAYETLTTQAKAEGYRKLAEKEQQYEEKQKTWGAPGQQVKLEDLEREDKKEKTEQLERTRDPAEAKAHYLSAKKAYDLEDYWRTIQLCQQAIEIVSDKAEYYHLLGLAQSENPKWRLDAERNFKIATNLDPWKSKYLSSLGKLYLKAGMTLRAQKIFEQAKAIDPTFEPPES